MEAKDFWVRDQNGTVRITVYGDSHHDPRERVSIFEMTPREATKLGNALVAAAAEGLVSQDV